MSSRSTILYLVVSLVFPVSVGGCRDNASEFEYRERYGFGTALPDRGDRVPLTAIPPDGRGLPPGSGTFDAGKVIYQSQCAGCHGVEMEGTVSGLPLIGGRGTLDSDKPRKTVESFWPYAPPVFSYIRNAMPTTAPGSLDDNEVYALMAYILGSADIIPEGVVVDRIVLPAVSMPNVDGFVPDSRPDVPAMPAGKNR